MILNFSKKGENMEFLMVLMFFVAALLLWLKPEKKRAVMGFGIAGVAILVIMMAWVNKFAVVPMGNF
jgi:hypothetical protein